MHFSVFPYELGMDARLYASLRIGTSDSETLGVLSLALVVHYFNQYESIGYG